MQLQELFGLNVELCDTYDIKQSQILQLGAARRDEVTHGSSAIAKAKIE